MAELSLDPSKFDNIHFVTDGGQNVVNAIDKNQRSYCICHCLNIVLKNAFSLTLISVDLYGPRVGLIVDTILSAVREIINVNKNSRLAQKLTKPPNKRVGATQFRSCIPALNSAIRHFPKVWLRYYL